MKITSIRGEVLLAAADSTLIGKTLKQGKIHLKVDSNFYFGVSSNEELFISSLKICTIANLVGSKVVSLAQREGFVDKDNVFTIDGIPYAQFATLIR